MGTNYYVQILCQCCGVHTEIHICKSLTSFEGYINDDDLGVWHMNPIGVEIRSWNDWQKILLNLTSKGWRIVNEYGEEFSYSDFVRNVNNTNLDNRSRHYKWMVNHSKPGSYQGQFELKYEWLDADQFSFTAMEFS